MTVADCFIGISEIQVSKHCSPGAVSTEEEDGTTQEEDLIQDDSQFKYQTGLTMPEIAIQEASPVVQSPTDDDADIPHSFVDVGVDELTMECRRHSDAGDFDVEDIALTQPLGSPDDPPDDVTDSIEEHPLSPTDYTLESDSDPAWCVTADTSQQIFIEQEIEAARQSDSSTPAGDRPLSPSHFTLVDDPSDESRLAHVAHPVEPQSVENGRSSDARSSPGTNPH